MKIIGWVRELDRSACGGTVVEGLKTCTGRGVPYTYQGARLACRKNCVIAEGFSRSTLSNGRSRVIHGMVTSGGCPLYSTLNDIDGVGNERGESVAEKYFLNADGQWMAVTESMPEDTPYDERPHLIAPPIEGVPYYIETMDGRTFSGRAEPVGLLPRIDTYGEDEFVAYWGDEALARSWPIGLSCSPSSAARRQKSLRARIGATGWLIVPGLSVLKTITPLRTVQGGIISTCGTEVE